MMRLIRNGFSVFLALASLASAFLAIYSRNTPTYIALATDIYGSFNQQPVIMGKAYAGLYAGVLRTQRMCLCGMLAADYETLSPGMQSAVADFFERNERWLAEVLKHGREDGTLSFSGSPLEEARSIVSGLEGAMLIARSIGDIRRFTSAASHLLAALRP